MEIILPNYVMKAIHMIEHFGGKAYAVGGAIRDLILGKTPSDYDIASSLLPSEVKECFKEFKIYNKNGERHGTVTVLIDNYPIEITTFRYEGAYLDGRHPLEVRFSKNVYDDLKRRDFTMNALAYDGINLIDLFGGLSDLNQHVIRTVGDPNLRFSEDHLRILRALRFSSRFGYRIEKDTLDSIHKLYKNLNKISKERIHSELIGILDGDNVLNVLLEFKDLFSYIIPELLPCIDFDQKSKYHSHDVYTHIAYVVSYSKKGFVSKMAALLHDIKKPECFTLDNLGEGHFHGHPLMSSIAAYDILKNLKCSNKEIEEIVYLIRYHDSNLTKTKESIKEMLYHTPSNDINYFKDLLDLKKADSMDHLITKPLTNEDILDYYKLLDEIIENKEPFKESDLKINGNDLIELNIKKEEIKDIKDYLMKEVISNPSLNNFNDLKMLVNEFLCEKKEVI